MDFFKTNYLTIIYDSENNCLLQTWNSYSNSVQFREGIIQTLKAVEKYHTKKLLSDTRKHAVVTLNDSTWVAKEIVPKLISAGLKYHAMVLPESIFGKMAIDNYQANVNNNLFIQNFKSREIAIQWLQTCK